MLRVPWLYNERVISLAARPGHESVRMSQLNVGTATDVSLQITEPDLSSLLASIRAPSGHEEPCVLKRLPSRHIGADSSYHT